MKDKIGSEKNKSYSSDDYTGMTAEECMSKSSFSSTPCSSGIMFIPSRRQPSNPTFYKGLKKFKKRTKI